MCIRDRATLMRLHGRSSEVGCRRPRNWRPHQTCLGCCSAQGLPAHSSAMARVMWIPSTAHGICSGTLTGDR
eukprot:2565078-Alexandrium_andersonii.AAC.1